MGNAAAGPTEHDHQPRRRHLSDLYDIARYEFSFHSFEHKSLANVSTVGKAHATNRTRAPDLTWILCGSAAWRFQPYLRSVPNTGRPTFAVTLHMHNPNCRGGVHPAQKNVTVANESPTTYVAAEGLEIIRNLGAQALRDFSAKLRKIWLGNCVPLYTTTRDISAAAASKRQTRHLDEGAFWLFSPSSHGMHG